MNTSDEFILPPQQNNDTAWLGRDLLKICRGSNVPNDVAQLNDTRNTQPALFVVESLLVDDLKRQGRKAKLIAGHSLGEISALTIAESITVNDALKIIKIRALYVLGFWFILQFINSSITSTQGGGVAYAAHIGGFLSGIILILFFNKYSIKYKKNKVIKGPWEQ